jgi:GNAT superfamily N-acetyltransferase
MNFRITETRMGQRNWECIERYSAQTVGYINDPQDDGDYRCFVAVGPSEEFIGLCIVDLGRLALGPLAAQWVGCLENILVQEAYRRQGIGTALLQAALTAAWKTGARCVWWTVEYTEAAALAFYERNGAVFIAEEDPQAEHPEKYYTVVITNPDLNS